MLTRCLNVLALASLVTSAAACFVETSSSDHGGQRDIVSENPVSGGPSTARASTAPILVDVDTDKTMAARSGEGVGVFTEYGSGGHWHVWWTCDTKVNPQGALTCDFLVRASVSTGAIKTVKVDAPEGAVIPSGTPTSLLEARTTTGAEIHGITFDTDPGAVLTLEAAVGEVRDPKYFFFVQNGKVNGGFAGQLSNPLTLEGATP